MFTNTWKNNGNLLHLIFNTKEYAIYWRFSLDTWWPLSNENAKTNHQTHHVCPRAQSRDLHWWRIYNNALRSIVGWVGAGSKMWRRERNFRRIARLCFLFFWMFDVIVGASVRYIEKRLCTSLELKKNRGRLHSVNSYYIQIMLTIYNKGLKLSQFTLGKVALNLLRMQHFTCSLMSNTLLQRMRISAIIILFFLADALQFLSWILFLYFLSLYPSSLSYTLYFLSISWKIKV